MSFWAGENENAHCAKQELLTQINSLEIVMSGKGFCDIDRQFMASVSLHFVSKPNGIDGLILSSDRCAPLALHSFLFSCNFI